jgi:hypothetical protein
MTAEVTIVNANVNSGTAVTLRSAKIERTIDNKITQIPIPSISSASKPNIALMHMKSVNEAFIITGYICKNDTFATPFSEMETLNELCYNNQNVCTLSMRDGSYTNSAGETITYQVTGYIKKLSIVDNYSGDFSTLTTGDAAYEIQIMFLTGVDILNMGS